MGINWADVIVGAMVLAVCILAVRKLVSNKKTGKTSCGCDCANCNGCKK